MHPAKRTLQKETVASTRLPRYKARPIHARKSAVDIRMASPSPEPQSRRDMQMVVDKDQTLINRDADNDAEWTDEELYSGDDDDNAVFLWEDEDTLFSDLLEEASPEAGEAELIALAESLQKPFDDESRQLKKDIARAFVPVVNTIKDAFASIDRVVDVSSGAGILALNDACREIENSILVRHQSVQKVQLEYRTEVTKLLGELEEEYTRRDQLWIDFEKSMDELVNPVLEELNDAPAKIERTITSIEKQSRVLEKEGASASASATELTLKELLSKLK